MIDFIDGPVPEDLCTIDQYGDADDFMGCGHCFENGGEDGADCENCIVSQIFKEYAKLTGQAVASGLSAKEYYNPEEITVKKLIEMLEYINIPTAFFVFPSWINTNIFFSPTYYYCFWVHILC